MCKLRIDTDDDARMRLSQSIVMYQGKPVYTEQSEKKHTLIRDMYTGETCNVLTDELDLTPVQVGNIAIGKSYMYVQRAPVRKWKQGVNKGNLKFGDMPWELPAFQLVSKGMANAIMGVYPAVTDAIDNILAGRYNAVPINRHWGFGLVEDIPRLLYKDKVVGFLEDDGEIIISKKYFFLKEDLLGVLNVR